MTEPVMPSIIRDLITFINRWPAQPEVWKRFRVAMTTEEVAAYKAYIKAEGNSTEFAWAVRGIPILIEPNPNDPLYCLEYLP